MAGEAPEEWKKPPHLRGEGAGDAARLYSTRLMNAWIAVIDSIVEDAAIARARHDAQDRDPC